MKNLAAIIVENRPLENFAANCILHMNMLPQSTDLIVYTSATTGKLFKEQFKKLYITPIFKEYPEQIPTPPSFNLVVGFKELLEQNVHLEPILHYCLFMTSVNLWKELSSYQRVLTFQTDTGLLRKGIEEFFDWDYVGAPCYNFLNELTIMNGGLSVRNPRMMEYICRYFRWETDLPEMIQLGQASSASFFAEDIFFCSRMIKYNIGNYPSLEISKKFAVESKFQLDTIGYHKIETYLTPEQVHTIKNQYKK
jgi:hypothetical protein